MWLLDDLFEPVFLSYVYVYTSFHSCHCVFEISKNRSNTLTSFGSVVSMLVMDPSVISIVGTKFSSLSSLSVSRSSEAGDLELSFAESIGSIGP